MRRKSYNEDKSKGYYYVFKNIYCQQCKAQKKRN